MVVIVERTKNLCVSVEEIEEVINSLLNPSREEFDNATTKEAITRFVVMTVFGLLTEYINSDISVARKYMADNPIADTVIHMAVRAGAESQFGITAKKYTCN